MHLRSILIVGSTSLVAALLFIPSPASGQDLSACSTIPPVAHRGATGNGEENTIEGWNKTLSRHNLAEIETDVIRTRDGKMVIFHDKNLRRTTGVDKYIRNVDYADLPRTKAGYQIPTFRDAIEWSKQSGVRMLIEVKVPLHWAEANEIVAEEGVDPSMLTWDYQPINFADNFTFADKLLGHTGIKSWPLDKDAAWLSQFGDSARVLSPRADQERQALADAGVTELYQKAGDGVQHDNIALWEEAVTLGAVDKIITNKSGAYLRWCQEQQPESILGN